MQENKCMRTYRYCRKISSLYKFLALIILWPFLLLNNSTYILVLFTVMLLVESSQLFDC